MDQQAFDRISKRAEAGEFVPEQDAYAALDEFETEVLPLYKMSHVAFLQDIDRRDTDPQAVMAPAHRRIAKSLRDAPRAPRPRQSDAMWSEIRREAVRKAGFDSSVVKHAGTLDEPHGAFFTKVAVAVEHYLETPEGKAARAAYDAQLQREMMED